jgi:hypothetical protein
MGWSRWLKGSKLLLLPSQKFSPRSNCMTLALSIHTNVGKCRGIGTGALGSIWTGTRETLIIRLSKYYIMAADLLQD